MWRIENVEDIPAVMEKVVRYLQENRQDRYVNIIAGSRADDNAQLASAEDLNAAVDGLLQSCGAEPLPSFLRPGEGEPAPAFLGTRPRLVLAFSSDDDSGPDPAA